MENNNSHQKKDIDFHSNRNVLRELLRTFFGSVIMVVIVLTIAVYFFK